MTALQKWPIFEKGNIQFYTMLPYTKRQVFQPTCDAKLIFTQEKQCVVAVVARAEGTQLDTQQEWVMVEARSGYYEQASQACNQIDPR
jgi:hypothetical protein